MCWVSTMGTGKSAGSAASTACRAAGPPVLEPIASTSGCAAPAEGLARNDTEGTTGELPRLRPLQAALMRGWSSSVSAFTGSPSLTLGLRIKSKAPAFRASTVRSASLSSPLVSTIAGRSGWSVFSDRRTCMPSMRGMVISKVITSGPSSAIFASASSPWRASPTSSTPSMLPTHLRRKCRNTGESSAISRRIIPRKPHRASPACS